jgi:DNA-directed RNA polymerase subunit RPC12/RpoP
MITSIVIFAVIFFIFAFPVKNLLEIKRVKKKDNKWSNWLIEKPSLQEYCLKNSQNPGAIKCEYCGSERSLPSLEMVISYRPKFGIISNSVEKYSHFKTYICSGCGTQLYRERYEE